MASNKRNQKKWIRHAAQKGDKILNKVILELCSRENLGEFKQLRGKLNYYLRSNQVIHNFHCGFNVKDDPCKITSRGRLGDRVEEWIYFIYTNYGIEAVRRYIIKELKKFLYEIDPQSINMQVKPLN